MDYVNPESKWPKIKELEYELNSINYNLVERLPVYDKYIDETYLKKEVYEKALKLQKRIKN